MSNKSLVGTLLVSVVLSAVLLASDYVPDLNAELSHNTKLIKEYKQSVQALQKRNEYLTSLKKANPKLYEEKALYEETDDAYIQRIKLNGSKAKNVNYKIEDHKLSLDMNIKVTRDGKDGYYESSKSFYEQYLIPKDVEESKITHFVDGDYYTIKMPKK